MPDNDIVLPPDLEELVKRYTERGIAIPTLRRLIRELLRAGLPTPQIETAVAQRLAQAGGSHLPAPSYQAMRQALLPAEPGPGWPLLSGALKGGGLIGLGGLLLGGSTPRSERGHEYGAKYFQTFGEPDPSILGQPEDPGRVAQIQATLRPPSITAPIQGPKRKTQRRLRQRAPTPTIASPRQQPQPSRLFRKRTR